MSVPRDLHSLLEAFNMAAECFELTLPRRFSAALAFVGKLVTSVTYGDLVTTFTSSK
jgi:hypothetical protein